MGAVSSCPRTNKAHLKNRIYVRSEAIPAQSNRFRAPIWIQKKYVATPLNSED